MHSIALPTWLPERRKLLPRVERLNPVRTALLVIDLQTYFVAPGNMTSVANALGTVPNVNRLARALRRRGGHVAWTRHTFSDDPAFAVPAWYDSEPSGFVRVSRTHLVPGSPDHEIYGELEVERADLIVDKHRFSPFLRNSSNLDAQLRARGIETLIVTGALTNCCCESTARDAVMLDYQVLFASDATAALTDEEHNASLLNLAVTFIDVRPTAEILDLIHG